MFDDTYKTIAAPAMGIYSEKRSKFLAYAFPVRTEEDVKAHLAELQKKHYDARHHCYAYILGPRKDAYRVNDNGEPSGTAGRPIYGQLLSKDLTDTLVVVVRYFGGIKLGVSGLQNAYKVAAKESLDAAQIVEKTIEEQYDVVFEYLQMNAVMQLMKDPSVTILSQQSDLNCTIRFSVRLREADRIVTALKKVASSVTMVNTGN
ncbi:MAG: YigZ family protein [Bacteroidales bacterium]|nr:YigZ family protein [Bacteroidales bacterium]